MTPIAFHFQLDPSKPDEERALMLLEEWQRSGWHVQKIIVMGLLSLGNVRPMIGGGSPSNQALLEDIQHLLLELQDQAAATLNEANNVLLRVQDLLENAQLAAPAPPPEEAIPPKESVSAEFLASVKKAMKPGIRFD